MLLERGADVNLPTVPESSGKQNTALDIVTRHDVGDDMAWFRENGGKTALELGIKQPSTFGEWTSANPSTQISDHHDHFQRGKQQWRG